MTTEPSGASVIARLERLPLSRWHIRARLLIGSATFFDAYVSIAIAYALPSLVGTWHLGPADVAMLISAGYLGQVPGALIFGWLAERWGRLPTAVLTVAIFALMSIACVFAWSAASLYAFRLLQGLGVGGEVPVAGAYINEFAGAKRRGRFFVLYELLFPIGLAVAGILGYLLVPHFGWRVMFAIGAIPALFMFFLRSSLPESPRWLVAKGRTKEASAIVTMMEGAAQKQGLKLSAPQVGLEDDATLERRATWRDIFAGVYARRTFLLWGLWVCAYMVINGLTTWLPTIYRTVFHLSVASSLLYGLCTNVFGLIGTLVCAWLIDSVGRKVWYIVSFFAGAVPLALLALLGARSAGQVVLLVVLGYIFIGTIGNSLFLYTGELYPTRVRAFATSIASAWLRVASTITPAIVGYMLVYHGLSSVFGYFALVCVAGGVISLFAYESKQQVLERLSP